MIEMKLNNKVDLPDGTYFVSQVWVSAHRDYTDQRHGVHTSEHAAKASSATEMAGTTKIYRYTVHQGAVTTKRK